MSEALAKTSYAVLAKDQTELRAIMTANVGTSGVGEFELDRVKVPAGGGISWEIPTLDGPATDKEIVGVIVAWRDPRAYWAAGIDTSGGGSPPDCSSQDGIRGVGDPGGKCGPCPMAQFGSASKDGKPARGQACKATRLLFMVRPGDLIPIAVVAPPSSLKGVKTYFLRLASQSIPFYGVVTALSLEKDKNKDGISYSKIVPKLIARLDDAAKASMLAYSETIKPLVSRVTVQAADVHDNE